MCSFRQGLMDDSTVFGEQPIDFARQWVEQGCRRLHLVDSMVLLQVVSMCNVVTEIAQHFSAIPIQIGGGIRSGETIEHYLKAGVNYVIIGTKAVKEPEFVTEMCQQFPGRIIVGLGCKRRFSRNGRLGRSVRN